MTPRDFQFANWRFHALTDRDGHTPAYSAVCRECLEASVGYPVLTDAENWTQRHAADRYRRGQSHTVFRMVTESWAVVRPA